MSRHPMNQGRPNPVFRYRFQAQGSGRTPLLAAVVVVLVFISFSIIQRSAVSSTEMASGSVPSESDAATALSVDPIPATIWPKSLNSRLPTLARTVASANQATSAPTLVGRKQLAPVDRATTNLTKRDGDRANRVEAQLAAGEFAPALETARSATSADERTGLLQAVAAARQSAAGGAAQVAQLVQLIKNTSGTDDDWSDDAAQKQIQYWPSGIEVDANGVLRGVTREEKGSMLTALGQRARAADLNTDLRAKSALRLVSLTRLEREVAKRLADGGTIPETMARLAGLSQIRYVFVYPQEHDVVIGGPAEGWRYDENGVAVGRESGRPTLFLDDFVTVLRTFSPQGAGYFNCQIVPRAEGLRRIKEFVAQSNARGPLEAGSRQDWANHLQHELGLQDVEIDGIPADSRVAAVIFEADYRLKMIGIGKLPGGPGIPSYFDLLPKTGDVRSQKMDALRWWLSMKYDAVLHSPDRNVFEIRGSGVLCQSENEKIAADGERLHTGQSEVTNRLFAANFTDHYAELASRDPIFADLENIFDLSLVAALLFDNRVPDRIGWEMGVFAPRGDYHASRYQPTKSIMSVVNHRVYNGKDIVVQVAGGVDGRIRNVLSDASVWREAKELAGVETKGRAPRLPSGRWWWDAESH